MRVLVAEDETELAALLAEGLHNRGYAVDVANDGAQTERRLAVADYDLVILDRDLPEVDGDDICARLAERPDRPGVLMLTAFADVEDRVDGLRLGADDYLGKPFAFAELVARLEALARRSRRALPPVLRAGELELDCGRLCARRAGREGHDPPPASQARRSPGDPHGARCRLPGGDVTSLPVRIRLAAWYALAVLVAGGAILVGATLLATDGLRSYQTEVNERMANQVVARLMERPSERERAELLRMMPIDLEAIRREGPGFQPFARMHRAMRADAEAAAAAAEQRRGLPPARPPL